MKIAAITLDLDDTLWPIEPVILRAERQLDEWLRQHCPLAADAYPIPAMRQLRDRVARDNPELAHDLSAQRRHSLRAALLEHGYAEEHVDAAHEHFYAARNEVECYIDTLPALEKLAARFPLVSLTNGNADLHRIGLAHFFQFSIASRDVGIAKPAPEIFHAACSRLGLAPAQVLHVGDDPHLDVAGARAAGLPSVWINRNGAVWSHGPEPDFTMRDLGELVTMLERDTEMPATKIQ